MPGQHTRAFLLVGHDSFRNRGCEAIVRTTTQMLREQFPGCSIALGSADARRDALHPAAFGLTTLDNWGRRYSVEWFGWQARKMLSIPIPAIYVVSRTMRRAFAGADAVLQVGGDNFGSDYGLSTGSGLIGCNEMAFSRDVPLVFWGATIGPFRTTELEELVLAHLRRAALITVRESITGSYLASHGITDNVVQVADPAFLLGAAPVETSGFWPSGERILALNVSPLCCRYRSDGDTSFGQKVAGRVITAILRRKEWGVLLLPHAPGDHQYLQVAARGFAGESRVSLAPDVFDSQQTKYIISRCDALMAARTHATIAGFSSGVPTISLAYSRKAYGLNVDLFGHDGWLLDIVQMADAGDAVARVERLLCELEDVAYYLDARKPALEQAAMQGASALAQALSPTRMPT